MRVGRRPLALFLSSAAVRSCSGAAFVRHHHRKLPPGLYSRNQMSSTTTRLQGTARVALCQFPVTEDKEKNHQTASDYLTRAAQQGAQLAVLPEIWNGPYATAAFAEYAEVLPSVGDSVATTTSPSASLMMKLAQQTNMWIVGGSIPETDSGNIYNTCLVINPEGNIVAKHRKAHLFDISVPGGITFRESDTLSPGASMTAFDGGDLFGMVGVGICYDIRFPEYALLLNQEFQCNLLIYPGAFNLTTGPAHWELLQRARAVDNQCYVMMASPARTEPPATPGKYPHYTAWGHSTLVAPWGDVVATCDEKEALVVADIDLGKVEEMRQSIPVRDQKRRDLYTLDKPK